MAIALRGTPTVGEGAGGAATVLKPTGTVDGDVLIAFGLVIAGTVAAAPFGWTLVHSDTSTSDRFYVYLRVASSEGSSWTWVLSGFVNATFVVAAYSGANTTTPQDVTYTSVATASATTVTVPGATTVTDGAWFVSLVAQRFGTAGAGWTPPAGVTEDSDIGPATYTNRMAVGHKAISPAGASGSAQWTTADLSAKTAVGLFLRPAGAPPPPPPPSSATMPGLSIEVAFASDPLATPSWVDISAGVAKVVIDTGREREEGRMKSGTMTVTAENNDRALDPEHAGSPFWPNVVPGRRIRCRATWSSTTYDLFTGFVEDWPQEYESSFSATVTFTSSDAFALFARMRLADSVWVNEVMKDEPTAFYRLGEGSGTEAADSSGHSLHGQYQPVDVSPPQDTLGVEGLISGDDNGAFNPLGDQLVSVPYKSLITGYPFTVECWIRTPPDRGRWRYALDSASGAVEADQSVSMYLQPDSTGSGGKFTAAITNFAAAVGSRLHIVRSLNALDDGARHHVVWRATGPGASTLTVDGVASSTVVQADTVAFPLGFLLGYAIGNVFALDPGTQFGMDGAAIDEMVFYNGVSLSTTRGTAHYTAGSTAWTGDTSGARVGKVLDLVNWPAGDRLLDVGNSTLVSAELADTVLEELQKVAEAEFGMLYMDGAGKVRLIGRHAFLAVPLTTSQATFGDTDAELPYEDVEPDQPARHIRNEISITPTGKPEITVSDATSRTRYGWRSHDMGTLPIPSEQARDLATYMLANYKDPRTRFASVLLEPVGVESTLYPQMLGRKIGDRVTVVRRPQSVGAAVTLQCRIEGIHHEFTATSFQTKWALSPVDTTAYWILGTSALGTDTRLAA